MPALWFDTETYCTVPLQHGTRRYAESAEIMLFSYAFDGGPVKVWDLTEDPRVPSDLAAAARDRDVLWWGQNSGMFDWPVIEHAMPWLASAVPLHRRRDTMVQAYCHSLPGSLEGMSDALGVSLDKRKLKIGRGLITLFCKPTKEGKRNTRHTHPLDWGLFHIYAAQDITAMRECHKRMPMWNYKGKQLDLWYLDQKINARGMQMDVGLALAAVRASEKAKKGLQARTQEMTEGAVGSATQRDEMLRHILDIYGITLPDMQAATIERRIADPDLPDELRELLRVRLQATTTSVAKYTTLLRGVNSDGRLRGCMQYRGAQRTGRVGHRLFQPGNMPRPDMSKEEIALAIEALSTDSADLVFDNVMRACSNAIRGTIIAGPGKKLVIADLANIEGRFAAWLAFEEWKLEAFRAYDRGEGPDLYVIAYATSFNVDPSTVGKGDKRQIGKVEELMFQYGGGVGAWITGAATYGIDLDKMTGQVWETLPKWAKDEAEQYLWFLYEPHEDAARKAIMKGKLTAEEIGERLMRRKMKARLGLDERTFIACDAIKRMWRRAHPKISSYWKELETLVKAAITVPGETFTARRVKIRRDGAWLRIGLPSGRALCYPHPRIETDGSITYAGVNNYTKKWERIGTYGGKLFENIVQAAACDQLLECGEVIDEAGFEIVMSVHDEYMTEAPANRDDLNAELLGALMCSDLGWNEGMPLAAAGFETQRYRKD